MTASPTKSTVLPRPPCAVGSVQRYQSVWVFWSSICSDAVATPKRKLPCPVTAEREPIAGKVIAGGPGDGDEECEQPATQRPAAARARGASFIGCSPDSVGARRCKLGRRREGRRR